MHKLFCTALNAYTSVFKIHVSNKDQDPTHHEFTGKIYEDLFEIVHTIGEKLTDTNRPILEESNKDFRKEVFDSIKWLKCTVDLLIKKDHETIWTDNALRGISDKLEFMLGNAKAYIREFDSE